jgi:1,4-dihydroxy-2-naphthoyl-CoA synthase
MTTRNWTKIKEYEDILFDFYNGIARITINRPRYRNAFTPTTTGEMSPHSICDNILILRIYLFCISLHIQRHP